MAILDALGEFGLDPRELAKRLDPRLLARDMVTGLKDLRPGAPSRQPAPAGQQQSAPVGPMSQPGPMGRTAAPADAGNPQPGKIAAPPPPPPGPAQQRLATNTAAGPPQLKGWKRALDVAGQFLAPRLEESVPGTPGNYYQRIGKEAAMAKEEQGLQEGQATMGKTLADTSEANARADASAAEAARTRALPTESNDFEVWAKQNPNTPVGEWLKLQAATKAPSNEFELWARQNPEKPASAYVQMQADVAKTAAEKPEIVAQLGERPQPGQKNSKGLTDVEWGKKAQEITASEAAIVGEARGKAYGRNRPVEVLDTWNGNRPIRVSAGEQEDNPERYVNASGGAQALMKGVTIDDIKGALNNVKKTTAVLDTGTVNRAVIAAALADPKTTAGNFGQSEFIKQLNPAERKYVIAVLTAREVAPGLRGLLGAGAATDARVKLLLDTLPGAQTPDSKYANQQIDSQLQTLERVRPGIPSVTPQTPGTQTLPPGAVAGMMGGKHGYVLNGQFHADE